MWPQYSSRTSIHATVLAHTHPFTLAVASGFFCGIGFLMPNLWPLVFVGLTPLLFVATDNRISSRAVFVYGVVTGVVLYGLATYAISWHTLPINWLGVFPSHIQVTLVAFSWLSTACAMALAVGVFSYVVRTLCAGHWHDIFLIAAAWVLTEQCAASLFSAVMFGDGSFIHTHFTLGFLGYLVAHSGVFIQAAAYGGVYLLSAFAAAAAAFLYYIFRTGLFSVHPLKTAFSICIFFAVAYVPIGMLPPTEKSDTLLRIAAVSLWESPSLFSSVEEDAASVKSISSLIKSVSDADIIVLPESAGFVRAHSALAPMTSLWARIPHTTIIDSESVSGPYGYLSSRLAYYERSGKASFSFKQFLLPDGEYVPYLFSVLVRALGYTDALASLAKHRTFLPGDTNGPVVVRGTPVSALFCNEAMSPLLYRAEVSHGASVLINVASQSWFHSSRTVAQQMETVARVRAVELRRWYIQSNNLAPAFVINPQGVVVAKSARGHEDNIVADIVPLNGLTPYARFGPWILIVSIVILLVYIARAIRTKMV